MRSGAVLSLSLPLACISFCLATETKLEPNPKPKPRPDRKNYFNIYINLHKSHIWITDRGKKPNGMGKSERDTQKQNKHSVEVHERYFTHDRIV